MDEAPGYVVRLLYRSYVLGLMAEKTSQQAPYSRRAFLYVATGVVAAAGIGAAAWRLIDHWRPSTSVRASDVTPIDLANLKSGEQRTVRAQTLPIFVARRTPAMLTAMQDPALVAQLVDADSANSLQPHYAKNWHRSIDPTYSVLVGVCTGCACVPQYFAEASALVVAGGYICPCCASHYDSAGRAYSGIARVNLPVPPHEIKNHSEVFIATGDCLTLFLQQNNKLPSAQNSGCPI
jgi:ubiquinol-cytochrome c reductase iron-sulfur subunit